MQNQDSSNVKTSAEQQNQNISPGLEGINVAATNIVYIDGKKGQLVYAGYMMEEIIAKKCCYEDVLFLFLRGHLPSESESKSFKAEVASKRSLSAELEKVIHALPKLNYMDALRIGISALGCEVDTTYPPTEEQVLQVVAKAPIILSTYYRLQNNLPVLKSNPEYGQAANYLYLTTGNKSDTPDGAAYARALDTYFVTTIEHGMNASTFTARVATSTQSDLVSAITAAISTLKGPLHGGAPSEIISMLEEIGSKENAEPWLENLLKSGGRIMGFGHRVYKSSDPRAKALQLAVEQLPGEGKNEQLDFSRHVEKVALKLLDQYKPGRNLYTNVEFWAAAILRAIGLPSELYPATFAIARTGGWSAHVLEQAKDNRLIRPSTVYVGKLPDAITKAQ